MKNRDNTQQIGICGELLVQYLVLKRGIESDPLTTDYGINLIACSKSHEKPFTFQVKTNLKSILGGGKEYLARTKCSGKHLKKNSILEKYDI